MYTEELTWLALSLARGADRPALHQLVEEGGPVVATVADPENWRRLAGRETRGREELYEQAAREAESARAEGYTLLTLASPDYPASLREIYDPPLALFCAGRIPGDGGVAVVGSREASHYGINIARSFARQIAARGFAVISGFARGIDTSAHLGALDAGGVTVAVIASGFHHPYPRENVPLIPRVAERGCVLTEHPLDAKPFPGNFPLRNRIISGLGTRGTLVVEAGERSGALITARLASDQGRDVFAIPGAITSPTSAGANRLIQQGAKLVRRVEDILEEIPGESRGAAVSEPLDAEESALLDRLSAETPVHVDDLSAETGWMPSQVLVRLLSLELKNRVRQLPGKLFLRLL